VHARSDDSLKETETRRRLHEIGVAVLSIDELLGDCGVDECIQQLDWLPHSTKITNKPAFIVSAIKKRMPVPYALTSPRSNGRSDRDWDPNVGKCVDPDHGAKVDARSERFEATPAEDERARRTRARLCDLPPSVQKQVVDLARAEVRLKYPHLIPDDETFPTALERHLDFAINEVTSTEQRASNPAPDTFANALIEKYDEKKHGG
jgi:hypothetical protein